MTTDCHRRGGAEQLDGVGPLTADVRIERHVLIRHAAGPSGSAWEPDYEGRLQTKMRAALMGRETCRARSEAQHGRCARCGDAFTSSDEWHVHHRHWRVYGGSDEVNNLKLWHADRHRQVHSQWGRE